MSQSPVAKVLSEAEAWAKLDVYRKSLGLPANPLPAISVGSLKAAILPESSPAKASHQDTAEAADQNIEVGTTKEVIVPSMFQSQQTVRVLISHARRGAPKTQVDSTAFNVHINFLQYYARAERMQPERAHNASYSTIELGYSWKDGFKDYFNWIYTQKIPEDLSVGRLVAVWVAADLSGTPKLQNTVLLRLKQSRMKGLDRQLSRYHSHLLYENTQAESLIRKYVVDSWDVQRHSEHYDNYPEAFLTGVMRLMSRKLKGDYGGPIDVCKYLVPLNEALSTMNHSRSCSK